jgi:two-component system, NarL family, sensor kinase
MPDAIHHRLSERVKELSALHRTARILRDRDRPVADLVEEVVALLPGAWQYPEVAAARIVLPGAERCTPDFRDTAWAQRADFTTRSGERGTITVVYLEPRPAADEGPFLAEERELLESLAEMLCAHLEHVLADGALRETRDALEVEVLERTADLRRLASRLTLAEERERRAIASDLHDHIGQALAIIKQRVREFRGNAVFGGFEDSLGETLDLLDRTIRFTRDLTGEISSPALYELGLEPGLRWLADRFTEKRGLRVHLHTSGRAADLPEELSVMLFQSARELLFNCRKHAGTESADLDLRWGEHALVLSVADRGRGFDPDRPAVRDGDGFGLFSIRERFRDLGGIVDVDSAPGHGCRVTITVPLPGGPS